MSLCKDGVDKQIITDIGEKGKEIKNVAPSFNHLRFDEDELNC